VIPDTGAARPVMVLLHGLGIDSAMWQPQLHGLAEHMEIHAPNLPDFGEGDARIGSVRAAADQLGADLEARRLGSVYLCGLSLGGMVAMALASRRPAGVRGLIVSGAQVRVSLWLRTLLLGVGRLVPERVLLSGTNLPPQAGPDLRDAEQRFAQRLGKAGILVAMRTAAETDLTEDLSRITCPTLVLCGERDNPLNRSAARRIAATVPGAQLRFIPGAGHVWNLEQPDRFNSELLRFVDAVERRA